MSVVVGTALSLLNQGDMLMREGMAALTVAKMAGNYLIPFLVCSFGYVSSIGARA